MVTETVRWAFSKALAVASASPRWTSPQRLPAMSGQTCAAPGFSASTASMIGSREVHSISMASAASLARSSVSATTKATPSPTWRTVFEQSTSHGGFGIGFTEGICDRQGRSPTPSRSAWVKMAFTPFMARAAEVSLMTKSAKAKGERST